MGIPFAVPNGLPASSLHWLAVARRMFGDLADHSGGPATASHRFPYCLPSKCGGENLSRQIDNCTVQCRDRPVSRYVDWTLILFRRQHAERFRLGSQTRGNVLVGRPTLEALVFLSEEL